ncbi:MAG: type II toxin-antitoxin system Phd/YefM family antitoxin [Acidimicrobiales bacterium]
MDIDDGPGPHKGRALSVGEAKARLAEFARELGEQHERVTLTRNGREEAVLVSVDDLKGLELTVEILADEASVAAIAEAMAEIAAQQRGASPAEVRAALRRSNRAC